MTEKEIRIKLRAMIDEIDALGQQLKTEQEDSEAEHTGWEEAAEEDRHEEPDVIDNSEAIERLETAMGYLDEAQGALTDDF